MNFIKWKLNSPQRLYGFILLCIFTLYSYFIVIKSPSYFQHFFRQQTHAGSSQGFILSVYSHESSKAAGNITGDVIRIMAVMRAETHKEYHCHVKCDGHVVSTEAHPDVHSTVYEFPYRPVDLLCPNPCGSAGSLTKVTVNTHDDQELSMSATQAPTAHEGEPQRDFTACISVFSNYSRAHLVQLVHMYQLLGAEKVFIYTNSAITKAQEVLAQFTMEGCVEVIDWRVSHFFSESNWEDFLNDIQVAAWRDCIYRNSGTSQKLALSTSRQTNLYRTSNTWAGLLQFFVKEKFTVGYLEVQDCHKSILSSSDVGEEQENTERRQAKCGHPSNRKALGVNTTFFYISLAKDSNAGEWLSSLAQCLVKEPPQGQVAVVRMRIQEKENAPPLVTPVNGTQAFVISAFYDDRQQQDIIRILGIVKRDQYEKKNTNLYCHVQCESALYVGPIEVDIHSEHFHFPYGATTLLCKNPCGSTAMSSVTVSTSTESRPPGVALKIQNTKESRPAELQRDFTVCISTMFNFSNVLQLIQSLEMYRLLGAGKVVIYKTSCSDQVQEVLDYYTKEGFVQVFNWTINLYLNPSTGWLFPNHLGDLHYHGQIATLNDCLYRNMYSSRYLVYIDQDEVILPYKHKNWRDLMDYLTKATGANIFWFTNTIFPADSYTKDPSILQWNDINGINILEHLTRETKVRHTEAKKMIIDPRIAYKTSVHYPLENFGVRHEVNEQVALLFHCKEYAEITEQAFDPRISHYEAPLSVNVNKVLSKTVRRSYPLVITPIDDFDVFIVSAFYDGRTLNGLPSDVIRIIGIAKRELFENQHRTLHCHIMCESAIHHHYVRVHLHDDHHGFPYGTVDLLCQNPCGSAALTQVAVSTNDVRILSEVYLKVHNSKTTQSTDPQRGFTVCISAMAGNYDNVPQLVQSIEMYRLLGAEKVFIYKTNCSAEVQKVLDYYTADGFLVVFNWTVDSYVKASEIFNHGQNTALHDCLYRNMYTSRYLVINDIGEIILPYRHDSWKDLLDSLRSENPRLGIFMFSSSILHPITDPKISGENTTGANEVGWLESKKIILDPRLVREVLISELMGRIEEVKEVSKDDALLFHLEDHRVDPTGKYEPRIVKFESKLEENVNVVLRETLR
ncbi:uncharacterized protein LOC120536097 [Polypterus senegalus]|uniref:uncharacterized protein LOC120536097 n=1 Tax=Polypterus senegalus TaxID=55291 RepID=UPI001964BC44|nr:uncharacterized protein LOC120536097 [Polypterus senegalus]